MKVLVVGTSPDTQGGITTVIHSYKDSFLWKKWNCTWIGSHNNKSVAKKLLYFAKGLISFLYHLPATDIVHIHFTFGVSAFRKRFFFYPAKLFGKTVIMHLHSPSFSDEEALIKFRSVRRFLLKADRIVVLSESWKVLLLKHIPHPDVRVIYNAVRVSDVSSEFELRQKRILYLGILNKRKGYEDLLRAFERIAHRVPEWKLEFGGNGALEDAKRMIDELGINKQTVVHGWVNGKVKSDLLSTSRIYCLPSYAEGFAMSVLEAFSNGLPVVVTPVGGLQEDLSDGEDVVFIEAGNVDDIACKLFNLIVDEENQRKLSRRSSELARSKFSYTEMIHKVDLLYSNN